MLSPPSQSTETKAFPTLFVSHGSPMLMLTVDDPEYLAIANLANEIPRPDAIVVVSAHWIEKPVSINHRTQPDTIHDFYGFPESLYQLKYPARGNAELSQRIAELLTQQDIDFKIDENHGLDHGAWAPLLMMYPNADIPVVQISLPAGDLGQMVQLGEALAPLREQSILILASGGSVHNLRERDSGGKTADWALEFEDWLKQSITQNRFDNLITPTRFPANFSRAHPTADHYVPLVVAWAAGGKHQPGQLLHQGFCYDNIGMSHYRFG